MASLKDYFDTEGDDAGVRKRVGKKCKCSEDGLFGITRTVAALVMGKKEQPQIAEKREVLPKGHLYVNTQPENARVRILNIGPKFHQGMEMDISTFRNFIR